MSQHKPSYPNIPPFIPSCPRDVSLGTGGRNISSCLHSVNKAFPLSVAKSIVAIRQTESAAYFIGHSLPTRMFWCLLSFQSFFPTPVFSRIWEIRQAKSAASFDGHAAPVTSLSFSENGYYLASAAADCVKLWDLRKLKNFK